MNAVARPNLSPDELAVRLHQQEQVAQFGLFALNNPSLDAILAQACIVASDGLQTDFAKVLRYRPATNDFLVVAGIGWREGTIGHATLGGGLDSPAGYALHTGQPTRARDLPAENRFRMPALLAEHGIRSAINVPLGGLADADFGVLEVDSTQRHDFVEADTAFMQTLANVLAAAVTRAEAERAKDQLLQDKDLLMQEVHHRVKNSLQLVHTLLQLQARAASPDTREQLDEASRRIMTIGAVHQRLYQGGSVAETDVAPYVGALLRDMQAMLDVDARGRTLALQSEPMVLPADSVTPLGLIVSELVTNSLKHGDGAVTITLVRVGAGVEISVADEGPGFTLQPGGSKGLGMRLVTALAKGDAAQAVRVDTAGGTSRVVVLMTV